MPVVQVTPGVPGVPGVPGIPGVGRAHAHLNPQGFSVNLSPQPGHLMVGVSTAQLVFNNAAFGGVSHLGVNIDGVFTQISADTDWLLPRLFGAEEFEYRITNVGEDMPNRPIEGPDVWLSLDQARAAGYDGPAAPVRTEFDVQLRYQGGPVLVTRRYYFEVTG